LEGVVMGIGGGSRGGAGGLRRQQGRWNRLAEALARMVQVV
jgi:hypothetical protein